MPPELQDIRVMIPRVRRALDGPQAVSSAVVGTLSDEQVKNCIADAIAAVKLNTGSVFGAALEVTERDPSYNAPSEYQTSRELTLEEQTVIALQAALDYFLIRFRETKVSESIQNEFQSWDWSLNGPLMRDQLKALKEARDEALDRIRQAGAVGLDTYASYLAAQDVQVAIAVEPYTVYDTGGFMPTRGGDYGSGRGGVGSGWDGDGLGGLGLFGP